MLDWFTSLPVVVQALLAGMMTWGLTALGAALVFVFTTIEKRVMNMMLGFAAGVMIAASFWSLLAPAIEFTEQDGGIAWIPAAIGFLAGGFFVRLLDFVTPHLHLSASLETAEGPSTGLKKTTLLFLAITLHNIPEGLAIGVAFGAAALNMDGATVAGALTLALGIGIQNMPEGLPCRFHYVAKACRVGAPSITVNCQQSLNRLPRWSEQLPSSSFNRFYRMRYRLLPER